MPFREFLPNMCRSAEETIVPEEAKIKHELPHWLKGNFIAAGPAKWDFNGFTLNSWLDGCCALSKFTILPDEKICRLQKKFLRTDYYNSLMKVGKPLVISFGTRAFRDDEISGNRKSFISRLISNYIILEQADNCGSIIHISDKMFAMYGETCHCHPLDLSNLNLVHSDRIDTTKTKGIINFLSHGLHDSQGNLFNVGLTVSPYGGCKTNVVKISNPHSSNKYQKGAKIRMKDLMKTAEIVASWPNRHATTVNFVHSFGMTENYIIYIDQPYYTSLLSIMTSTVKGQCFKDILKWHPEEKSIFKIVDKRTSQIFPLSISSKEPFYFNHVINSYEEDDHIIIDIMTAADPSFFEAWNLSKLRNKIFEDSAPMTALRFVIPLKPCNSSEKNLVTLQNTCASAHKDGPNSIMIVPERLTLKEGMEGPVLNPKYFGKNYTFFYTGQTFQASFFGQLGKFNVKTKECVGHWKGDPHHCVGQPVFIPHPQGSQEDDGIVLSGVTSGKDDCPSFLLFLDGKTFKEMTRIEFKTQIPLHLHSYFWGPELVDC